MHILVVENCEVSSQLIAKVLEKADWQVTVSENPRSALQLVLTQRFDAVITELLLPGMSGINFVQAMRNEHRTRHIPVLVCSAVSDKETIVRAMHAGVQDYILKPFDGRSLVAKLRGMERTARASSNDHDEEALSRLRLTGDRDFMAAALHALAEETRETVVLLGEALCGADLEHIATLSTRIEGAASSLGVDSIGAPASLITDCAMCGDVATAISHLGELEGALVQLEARLGGATTGQRKAASV